MSALSKLVVLIIFVGLFFVWKEHSSVFHSEARKGMPQSLGEGMICPVLPPSVRSGADPLQTNVPAGLRPLQFSQATIIPLAGYSIEARVLSRKDYSHDVSPMDILVGWGPMAREDVTSKLVFGQNRRFGSWTARAGNPPISYTEINRHAANMHLIPANYEVAKAIAGIRVDDTVRLHGWLVRVEQDNGRRWSSSLSRTDQGDGACELMLVCDMSMVSSTISDASSSGKTFLWW